MTLHRRLFAVAFVDLMGVGLIIPLVPSLIREDGLTAMQVAMLLSLYPACQALCALAFARTTRRVRPLLLVGATLLVAAFGYAGMAAVGSLWALFLGRALTGAMAGNVATAQTLLALNSAPADRVRVFGTFGGMQSVGFVAGVVVASGASALLPPEEARAASFLAGAVLSVAASAGILALGRSPQIVETPPAAPAAGTDTAPARYWLAFATFLFLVVTLMQFTAMLPVQLSELLRFGGGEVGLLFVLVALINGTARFRAAPWLAGRFRFGILMAGVFTASSIGHLLYAAVASIPALPPAVLILIGGSLSAGSVVVAAQLSRSTPAGGQARIMASFASLASLAAIVGPLIGGALISTLGFQSSQVSMALLVAAFGMLFWTAHRSPAPGAEPAALQKES